MLRRLSGRGAKGRTRSASRPTRRRRRRPALHRRIRRAARASLRLVAGAAVVMALSYGGVVLLRAQPEPVELPVEAGLPVFPVMPDEFDGLSLAARLDRSEVAFDRSDDLLATSLLDDPDFARAVHWWIGYWRGPARRWFPGFLERMAWLGTSVDSALAARGLPPSLRYLPLIESGYDPRVTSRASAVGLWQLMPATAVGLGLEVSPLIDQRRSPVEATDAALAYVNALHREFGSWFLTLAAYNSGPGRVRGILRRYAPDAPRSDSVFWALRDRFPAETRDFLPKLYGAMWVASRPEAYGYEVPSVEPFRFDVVRVPDKTTLDVVGLAAGVSQEDIVRLNPEFLVGMTPPGRSVTLRVPAGQGHLFTRQYRLVRPDLRVTFVKHVVASGETISRIADRYGVRAEQLEAANPHVHSRTLQVGARLTVPVSPMEETPR